MPPSLSGASNAVFIDNCQSLQNLTVRLQVLETLVTSGNTGFSLQLNSYPQPGSTSQGQALSWFQYVLYAGGAVNNQLAWEIQYWAIPAPGAWPPGYTPNPNTTPWLPALPNDFSVQPFGPAIPSNQILAGSVLQIQLTTAPQGSAVTGATFSFTDPQGNTATAPFTFPNGAVFPIYGFQVDVVGPGGGAACVFTSGTGILTYSVAPGTLAVQGVNSCGGLQPGTTETSNAIYGDPTPSSGSSVLQTLNVPAADPAIPTIGGSWVLVQGSGFLVTGTISSVYIQYLYSGHNFYRMLSKGFEWYIQSDTDLWALIPPLDDASFLPLPPPSSPLAPAPVTTTIQTAFVQLYRSATPPAPPDVRFKIIYEYLPRVEEVAVDPVLWTGQSSAGSATLTVVTPPALDVPVTLSAAPANEISFTPGIALVPAGGKEPPVAAFVINTPPMAAQGPVSIQACVAGTPLSYSPCASRTVQVSSADIALLVISSTALGSPTGAPGGALDSGAPITFGIYLRHPTPGSGPAGAVTLDVGWASGAGRYTIQQTPVFGSSTSSATFILTPFVTSGYHATLSVSVTYDGPGVSNTITLPIGKPLPVPPLPPGGRI